MLWKSFWFPCLWITYSPRAYNGFHLAMWLPLHLGTVHFTVSPRPFKETPNRTHEHCWELSFLLHLQGMKTAMQKELSARICTTVTELQGEVEKRTNVRGYQTERSKWIFFTTEPNGVGIVCHGEFSLTKLKVCHNMRTKALVSMKIYSYLAVVNFHNAHPWLEVGSDKVKILHHSA